MSSVYSLNEAEFGRIIGEALSPSKPLDSIEHLHGREPQIQNIKQALYSKGRHIFIHGYRGVGKTSLARTVAFSAQSSDNSPVILGCNEDTTCFSLVRDILAEEFAADPRLLSSKTQKGLSAKYQGLAASICSEVDKSGQVPIPTTLNEAVRYLAFFQETHSETPVIVVDELDKIKSEKEQHLFADLVKQVSDKHINVTLIFCGIGESVAEVMKGHRSAHRYFHTQKLERLSYDGRLKILKFSADALGIQIDDDYAYRVARISDGFPHYVHLIAEKLYWLVYRDPKKRGRVNGDIFEEAIRQAVDSMEPELKIPYEQATRKYSNDYEEVLFAVADGHQLERPSREIYQSYERIMHDLRAEPLDRTKFNSRMNNLKKPSYASILKGTSAGWYEYTEKVLRGFARLRAEQRGLVLERETPLQERRHVTSKSSWNK